MSSPQTTTARLAANTHIHLPPNFSAFRSISQAVDLAAAQGLRALGASNYYDYSIYEDFASCAKDARIVPLFGLEIITLIDDLVQSKTKINDPGNPGKMYVCGKAVTRFSPMSDEAAALLQVIRESDSKRMEEVVARLAQVFESAGLPTGLDASKIIDQVAERSDSPRKTVTLQERHVAQAFQKAVFEAVSEDDRPAFLSRLFGEAPKFAPGDAVATQNAIRSYLMKAGKAAYAPETFVDFDHAFRLILALGGIPSYPVLADGAVPICPFEAPVDGLITRLAERNVHAAEFIPIRNSATVLAEYVPAMRDAGLLITAGTEHNTLDLLPLEPTCVGGEPIPAEIATIFWEGACVLAAHQSEVAQGRSGFVDANGTPAAGYGDAHERIQAFREIGESILGSQL
jgi:hypothetical protein